MSLLFILALAAAMMTGFGTASAEECFQGCLDQDSDDEDASMLQLQYEEDPDQDSVDEDASMLQLHYEGASQGSPKEACNEEVFDGVCLRICTDMTQMEPRQSSTNCGGHRRSDFAQFCDKHGKVQHGFGEAPGTNGRKEGKCFGSTESKQPAPVGELTNMPIYRNASEQWECTLDPVGTPAEVALDDKGRLTVTCNIPPNEYNVLVTKNNDQCRTFCDDPCPALMFDRSAFCCTENRIPSVSGGYKAGKGGKGKGRSEGKGGKGGKGSYKVHCICG